jgi:putative transposase
MGKVKRVWQETDEVLGMFGKKEGPSRRHYNAFVEKGMVQGNRKDLSGGGLIRSARGWEGVKELKKDRIFQKSDERVLGDSGFVERVLKEAEERWRCATASDHGGWIWTKQPPGQPRSWG